MKTKAIIAALVAAAAGLAVYFFIKRRNNKPVEQVKKTHHLTEAFVRAKEYAGDH